MENKEALRIVAVAGAGFFAGQVWEQYKIMKKRRKAMEKFNSRDHDDFWKTITKYLNDPNDNRTTAQLVDDWQTNHKFHKIIEDM